MYSYLCSWGPTFIGTMMFTLHVWAGQADRHRLGGDNFPEGNFSNKQRKSSCQVLIRCKCYILKYLCFYMNVLHMAVQWLALSPHSKKVPHLNPSRDVSVRSLHVLPVFTPVDHWFPPSVQCQVWVAMQSWVYSINSGLRTRLRMQPWRTPVVRMIGDCWSAHPDRLVSVRQKVLVPQTQRGVLSQYGQCVHSHLQKLESCREKV